MLQVVIMEEYLHKLLEGAEAAEASFIDQGYSNEEARNAVVKTVDRALERSAGPAQLPVEGGVGAEECSAVNAREEGENLRRHKEQVERQEAEEVERQELPAGFKLCGGKRKYIETPIEVGKSKGVKIHDKSSLEMLHSKGRFLELSMRHLKVLKKSGFKNEVKKNGKEAVHRVAGESIEDGRAEEMAGDCIEDERVGDCIEDVRTGDCIEDVTAEDCMEDVRVEDYMEDVRVEDCIEDVRSGDKGTSNSIEGPRKKASREEFLEDAMDRLRGSSSDVDHGQAKKDCAVRLIEFVKSMRSDDAYSRISEEIMMAKAAPNNPLNVYPPDVKRNLYVDIVDYASVNLPELLTMILTYHQDFSKNPTEADIVTIGNIISTVLLSSSRNHNHSNSLARVRAVVERAQGKTTKGLQMGAKLGNSLGKDAYYAAREEHVVAGQALNQAMSEEGVMNITFDNCNWKIGEEEQNNVTLSFAELERGFEEADLSDEKTLKETLALYNLENLLLTSEVNTSLREHLDMMVLHLMASLFSKDKEFKWLGQFLPDHYHHDNCLEGHTRSSLILHNIIPLDENKTPEMVQILFR